MAVGLKAAKEAPKPQSTVWPENSCSKFKIIVYKIEQQPPLKEPHFSFLLAVPGILKEKTEFSILTENLNCVSN